MQTEIKRLSQVQYIIAFSSKNALSHHHRPFFLATTNIIVQLETENNSPSGEENYITMTTRKKFNYQQDGADAVLIVSWCVLVGFVNSSLRRPQLASVCWSWQSMAGCCFVWCGDTLNMRGPELRGWDASLAHCSFSVLSTVFKGGPRRQLIGSGDVI